MTIRHLVQIQIATDLLARAVACLHAMEPNSNRNQQIKKIHRLAKQLLAARLRWRQAQIVALDDIRSELARGQRSVEIDALQRTEAEIRSGGIQSILAEFGGPGRSQI